MEERILQIIKGEDSKNPLTDEEIASRLQVFREDVTTVRREHHIPDSRKRRKPVIFEDMKRILTEHPDVSDRGLTRMLEEAGYRIGKYAAGRLREELLEIWTPFGDCQEKEGAGLAPDLAKHTEYAKHAEYEEPAESGAEDERANAFSAFVGFDGSMKTQITRAQAAVLYPPRGLHCLIYGPSGVGKSFLAELMHEYACGTENFGKDAPYFEFNCADYADNPQLLLAQLFGYSKGAFTGASDNKKGVVELCNGGILFLDEVHRLPPEGQEILFYLMDKGRFRRLGEVDTQRESHVMVIAATTENPQSSLLLTFRRRIPMVIEIPSLKDRPAGEKLQFILRFFQWESRRLGKQIKIRQQALWCLLGGDCPGNVGQLKSDIQVCCAKAFLEGRARKDGRITVSFASLTENLRKGYVPDRITKDIKELCPDDCYVFPDDTGESAGKSGTETFLEGFNIYESLEEKYDQLLKDGLREQDIEVQLTDEIESRFQRHIHEFQKSGIREDEIASIVGDDILRMTRDICDLARKRLPGLEEQVVFPLAIHLNMAMERMRSHGRMVYPGMENIRQQSYEDYEAACYAVDEIQKKYYLTLPEEEKAFLAMYFRKFRKKDMAQEGRIGVLVVSHGPVASGMAQVANAIMGTEHAVGVDMNLWDTPAQMAEKTVDMARRVNQGKGCIVLADMGSLLNVGQKIREETGMQVRVLPRTDTMMVVEAVRKTMWTDESLNEIADELDKIKLTGTREQSESRKKAILCLCITGQGAAVKLKEHLTERLKSNLAGTVVVTRGYIEDSSIDRIIANTEKEYEILAIVGTINPDSGTYPFISVSRVYSPEGIRQLRGILKRSAMFEENQLSEVISLGHIYIRTEAEFKDQIIDEAVGHMAEEGLVRQEFLLSVYKREGMMTTRLSQGNAIPHGDPGLVTKPVISVTKLDKPVLWDGVNTVDVIFVLAIQEDSRKYFEQLYQIISDESMVSAIRASRTREEIRNLLCKNTKSVN